MANSWENAPVTVNCEPPPAEELDIPDQWVFQQWPADSVLTVNFVFFLLLLLQTAMTSCLLPYLITERLSGGIGSRCGLRKTNTFFVLFLSPWLMGHLSPGVSLSTLTTISKWSSHTYSVLLQWKIYLELINRSNVLCDVKWGQIRVKLDYNWTIITIQR